MVALLQRLFGASVADALRAPFVLGDAAVLRALFDTAPLRDVGIDTQLGEARFPSIEAWVRTDVKGWTLADAIDDAQYKQLQQAAQNELRQFATADGSVRFAAPAHIVTAVKTIGRAS